MIKPNAVEEMMAAAMYSRPSVRDSVFIESNWAKANQTQKTRHFNDAKAAIAALDAAGLAIVPHDWNHREEDWSLQSVSEWLER